MSDEKKCECVEENDTCECVCPGLVSANLDKLIELLKLLGKCRCCLCCDENGDGDGDGPGMGDGDGDEDLDEYLLDIDMKSDEGDGEFKPIASSVWSGTPGTNYKWHPFQKSKASSTDARDCWACAQNESYPQHLGLIMDTNRYIVTKVEYDTRNVPDNSTATPSQPPKELNLKYRDTDGDWHDLTDRVEISPKTPANQTVIIDVPKERQVAGNGIRLEIYSAYDNLYPNIVNIARMRVWVKDVK